MTLGCSKNLVDSEVLMMQLRENDFDVVHDGGMTDEPNIVIINTCGFIERAKEESINTILEYAEVRSKGDIEKLYVTGCLSHRYKDELETEIPEVDAYFGTLELPALLERLEADYKHELLGERILSTPPHYAYLKISEGCNRTCAFCAIPLMRGEHRSKTIEAIVTEAKSLAKNGVKEIMLIAQELTYYGLDIYRERKLPELLEALSAVDGIEWIRLHYAFPSKFPRAVFNVIAKFPNLCNYLDIPLQHANDQVLLRMKRQITRAEQEDLIEHARKIIPGIAIRTTLLVGFPGETEEEFNDLCDFVKKMEFERVGVFTYSHEENTPGYVLKDDIPESVKVERANTIMEIQREISLNKNQSKIGKVFKVLFDRIEGGYFVGRTEHDSPEVDNEVLVPTEGNYARIGDFARVKITDAREYDLFGEII